MKKLTIALLVMVAMGLMASHAAFAQEEPPDEGSIPPQTSTDAPGVGQGEAGDNTADNAPGGGPSGRGDIFVLLIEVVVIIAVIGAIVAIVSKARKPKEYYPAPESPGGTPSGGRAPPGF
ncbi:MAG: hypothetical protein AB1305_02680 [Candidatus Hadarchaeota archaeon]